MKPFMDMETLRKRLYRHLDEDQRIIPDKNGWSIPQNPARFKYDEPVAFFLTIALVIASLWGHPFGIIVGIILVLVVFFFYMLWGGLFTYIIIMSLLLAKHLNPLLGL